MFIGAIIHINMTKIDRDWNKNFVNYTEFIAKHKNYNGLFIERGQGGNLKWVVAGKSEQGKNRRAWWDVQCKQKNITIKPGCYAEIASIVHPTKKHVCQICGKELLIDYVYPNKRLLNLINSNFQTKYLSYTKDIFSIIDEVVTSEENLLKMVIIFKAKNFIPNPTKNKLTNFVKNNHVNIKSKVFLSPGVMSNSPDRFDGFHSDGNCCRGTSDKGRHKSNLSRYNQDRRAYVNWADGDWKQADRLMAMYSKYNLSADHIGPISLGFCHRPRFQAMTREENSTKNNRMTFKDVQILINDENNGQVVISWHSKYIWDLLKKLVKNDADALKLSKNMRLNLHYILMIFSILNDSGHKEFLKQFLHPEFSFFDYKFHGFNPKDGTFSSIETINKNGKNQQNNVSRYERIAFDELKSYFDVNNRRVQKWNNLKVDSKIEDILKSLSSNNIKMAKTLLEECFNLLANDFLAEWKNKS